MRIVSIFANPRVGGCIHSQAPLEIISTRIMSVLEKLPEIIQGGMGVGVSNWCLASVVSRNGQLGVVSGTALETVVARRLQMGDHDGSVRRALANFPLPDMARRFRDAFFVPNGKPEHRPFKMLSMPNLRMKKDAIERMIVGNFVEVFLAKEGHDGVVGINFLEKIQLPTLPSLFGAMLAGVDYVLMGAGIPLSIPGILDKPQKGEEVELRINVDENPERHTFAHRFDPKEFFTSRFPKLKRPKFLAIISSDILAKTFVRRATGFTDGFIIENHTAGGHNAPPRKIDRSLPAPREYSEKDSADLDTLRDIGRPFWLAGGFASPEALRDAQDQGAQGIQLGTIFAYSKESGILPEIKEEVLQMYFDGNLKVKTDFDCSPTGFPFKVITLKNSVTNPEVGKKRGRICDMGYLRTAYVTEGKKVGYRCSSEPIDQYLNKGGKEEETLGKHCLCNGLMSTIGLGQAREVGSEPPIVTSGDDFSFLDRIMDGPASSYSATDVLDYLTEGLEPLPENAQLESVAEGV